jgi:hypothetical protein
MRVIIDLLFVLGITYAAAYLATENIYIAVVVLVFMTELIVMESLLRDIRDSKRR